MLLSITIFDLLIFHLQTVAITLQYMQNLPDIRNPSVTAKGQLVGRSDPSIFTRPFYEMAVKFL